MAVEDEVYNASSKNCRLRISGWSGNNTAPKGRYFNLCLFKEQRVNMSYIFDQFARSIIANTATHAYTGKPQFPHFNIVKTGERRMEIHIALSGYKMSDIQITQQGENLIIESKGVADGGVEYMHKGFTTKGFARSFILNNEVYVQGADFKDGILVIFLNRIIPEKQKVRNIPIGQVSQQLNG